MELSLPAAQGQKTRTRQTFETQIRTTVTSSLPSSVSSEASSFKRFQLLVVETRCGWWTVRCGPDVELQHQEALIGDVFFSLCSWTASAVRSPSNADCSYLTNTSSIRRSLDLSCGAVPWKVTTVCTNLLLWPLLSVLGVLSNKTGCFHILWKVQKDFAFCSCESVVCGMTFCCCYSCRSHRSCIYLNILLCKISQSAWMKNIYNH